jgi:hypothetical protein
MSIDDLQAQLRGTLDQQFAALKQKYEDGIVEARRQADADAAAGREQARAEADARVRSVVEQARAAAERAIADRVGQARAEAEVQFRAAVEETRAAAEREVAAQLERARAEFEQARAEWETQLQAAAETARTEGEQAARAAAQQEREALEQNLKQAAAEAAQQEREALEQKLEQAVADASQREREALEQKLEEAVDQAIAAARRGAELELESERRRAQNEIESEREKAKAGLEAASEQARTEIEAARQKLTMEAEAERQRAQTELEQVRESMQAAIAVARQAGAASVKPVAPEPAAPAVTSAVFEQMLTGVQEIDGATTLSQALESLLKHSTLTAGRAAIFLVNGDRLKAWKSSVIPDADVQTVESSIGGKDLLARAIQAGQAMASGPSLPAPPFARLPAGRPGLAVPLMINGRAVAVLYADSGTNPPPLGVAEIVEGLVRHTSAIVALRTAMRNLDLVGGAPNGESPAAGAGEEDDQGARRFARLLLSEIKLYNEGAVRVGREQRDIRRRLREEIDRAQRLYEERVPLEVAQRLAYFQQELVQTLADGDPALLGEQ